MWHQQSTTGIVPQHTIFSLFANTLGYIDKYPHIVRTQSVNLQWVVYAISWWWLNRSSHIPFQFRNWNDSNKVYSEISLGFETLLFRVLFLGGQWVYCMDCYRWEWVTSILLLCRFNVFTFICQFFTIELKYVNDSTFFLLFPAVSFVRKMQKKKWFASKQIENMQLVAVNCNNTIFGGSCRKKWSSLLNHNCP